MGGISCAFGTHPYRGGPPAGTFAKEVYFEWKIFQIAPVSNKIIPAAMANKGKEVAQAFVTIM